MEETANRTFYFGRRSHKEGGYDWIVRIDNDGCFVTDPIEDWDKDDDYRDEASSNPALYRLLEVEEAKTVLASWNRSLA
jgi:hypothetical protein